jgi:hypothetical protein
MDGAMIAYLAEGAADDYEFWHRAQGVALGGAAVGVWENWIGLPWEQPGLPAGDGGLLGEACSALLMDGSRA